LKTVFIAGASGAVGLPLVKLLVREKKYKVIGTTRSKEKAKILHELGATGVIVDIYDVQRLQEVLRTARPDIVIHQLTDLPFGLPVDKMAAGQITNARIRTEGTRNLIEAIATLELEQILVQGIGFMYSEGPLPHVEADSMTTVGLQQFEGLALNSGHKTTIMRYGRFYGPKTGFERVDQPCRVHVEAAAYACQLLLSEGKTHIYNICEDSDYASNQKVLNDTHWDPDFRI
jgi:nucleoside-diphosphate-sugar epimerase